MIRIDFRGAGCFRRDRLSLRGAELMSNSDTLICRPTKWFLWRALAMLLLFGVFTVLFFRDWKVGYPKKNVVFYTHEAFEAAREAFAEGEANNQTASQWEAFAKAQKIGFPDEPGVLPEGVDPDAGWPDVLVDYESYGAAYKEDLNKTLAPMWLSYSHAQGWGSEPPKSEKSKGKIQEQFYIGCFTAVLTILSGFYLIRTGRRSMRVDGEAYYAPGGQRIPFERIRRIDARKWAAKGLAYLYYEGDGGGLEKAKVDGMVYGQFKEEEGAPAEQLYQQIFKNFSGELVELEGEDEVEDGPAAE